MSVDLNLSDLQNVSVYKYPLGSGAKTNFIPIFIANVKGTYNDYFKSNQGLYINGFSVFPWSTYKFSQIYWGYQRKQFENFHDGVFGNYEDSKITIASDTSTAGSASFTLYGKKHNSKLASYSTGFSVNTFGVSYVFQFAISGVRSSDGKIIATGSNTSVYEDDSKASAAVIFPTSGLQGSYSGKFTDYNMNFYCSTTINDDLANLIEGLTEYDPYDPNPGGGDSKPSGGGGDGDIGGDTNPDDGLPTISALDSGLLTAYNPTVGELQSLGKFLWSDSFDVNTFKKLFNNPFDTLLGLSVVPVKPNISGTKNIMFGNMDSGVSAAIVSNQWVTKDMGSVTLKEVWKGALDYAPSTGVTIYLPFIGMRQLNVNDVMGSTLHLIYKFDVLTGACIAQIYVNHSSQGNKDGGFSWNKNQGLVYEFIGQCAENIPLASQDFTNTIRAAIGGVSVAAGAAASVATGNPALGMAALTVGMANSGMQASTPTVERGGHLSGSAAIMGYSQPFLIVERPHQCKPSRYYALRGVPSQVYTSKLSNCTGFTQITANNNIHCSGAQDTELQEIQNLLVSGVYFPDSKR